MEKTCVLVSGYTCTQSTQKSGTWFSPKPYTNWKFMAPLQIKLCFTRRLCSIPAIAIFPRLPFRHQFFFIVSKTRCSFYPPPWRTLHHLLQPSRLRSHKRASTFRVRDCIFRLQVARTIAVSTNNLGCLLKLRSKRKLHKSQMQHVKTALVGRKPIILLSLLENDLLICAYEWNPILSEHAKMFLPTTGLLRISKEVLQLYTVAKCQRETLSCTKTYNAQSYPVKNN